jgi:hypothetical protein
MNWRTGLRRGRSHIFMAAALAGAGFLLIRLDDEKLASRPSPPCADCVNRAP